ncbi:uncharacterized protein MKK02DRAFT_23757 [Dioszegia hungarica]|uniref:Uncharacterized protein n=1 Tax=Dioszegia hungarica TaxID=4972 RepID=A0AA38HBP7_9TREE|nr:uncharacterized protein MKK02DRAFT_23757 [Dioszegia hungarica]KAI9637446.1 hypothetical protein MKK02DRAFT_23757 [Dioszegia hungarica]
MLEIGLVPKASGSAGFGRFYPHEGYLGFSPVVVGGTIVSRLPPLYATLPTRQVTITIRCVATRTIGSEVEAVLWEKAKRLWEPAGESEYEELGDWTSPFQVVVPVEAAWEAASAQWTRDLKVAWQLQVAFDHKPIPYVGNRIVKTYLLNLHSYVHVPLPPPSPPSAVLLPGAQVSLNPPHGVFGPGDPFTVSFHVKPDDPSASIRRTTLILERRTQLIDVPTERKARKTSPSFPTWRRSHSPQPYTKLEEPSTHTTKIMEMTTDEAVPGSGGTYWVSMTGMIPKREGKWEAGETGETKVTRTTFECRVKVSLKTKSKSAKEISCPPVPIILVGTSSTERATAQAILAAEAEAHPKASLPKRRHRSSRRGLYMHEGTTDIADPVVHGPRTSSGRRRRHETAPSASPASPIEGVKPILLPSNPTPQPQSISFAFPAKKGSRPALPITTLIHPPSPSATPTDTFPPDLYSPPVYPDMSLIRQFQSSGRRISTSTSEEDEMQPSRSRIRLNDTEENPFFSFPRGLTDLPLRAGERPSLPSLDVLGLRLPPVPEYDPGPRRPRTAPVHSAFPPGSGGASSSLGMGGKSNVPPPLSGGMAFLTPDGKSRNAGGMGARPVTSGSGVRDRGEKRIEEEGPFAFGMQR